MESQIVRAATLDDADYLAQCLVKIATYLKKESDNIYVNQLQNQVDESMLDFVRGYINLKDAIALVAEADGEKIACLLGKITETIMPESSIGRVGNITICWVEAAHRKSGLARQLVQQAESWFKQQQIEIIELSYIAQNIPAEIAWASLGYTPFRIYSYKKLP